MPKTVETPPQVITGIPKKVFYTLLAVCVIVVLAAIGGSVGAHFATQKSSSVSSQSLSGSASNGATGTLSVAVATGVVQSTAMATISTTTAPTGTSVGIPNPCATTSAFTSGLFWMGTYNEDEVVPVQWFQLYDLNSAPPCCEYCFNLTMGSSSKCNVWGYFPLPYGNGGNQRDTCAIIWGYNGGDKDSTCTEGKPPIGLLKPTGRQTKYADGTGAPGPCAGSIYTFTTVGQ